MSFTLSHNPTLEDLATLAGRFGTKFGFWVLLFIVKLVLFSETAMFVILETLFPIVLFSSATRIKLAGINLSYDKNIIVHSLRQNKKFTCA